MKNLNRAQLIGNVTRDAELKFSEKGNGITTFSVATNHSYKDGAGQLQESTEFHRLVAFGKLAEFCGQYLTRGRKVYVEGRLQTREYESQGQKRSTTEIVASEVILLDSRVDSTHETPDTSAVPTTGGAGEIEDSSINF